MKWPTYSTEHRHIAKATGQYLVTVDFVRPNGSRVMAYSGPMTKEEAKIVADAWIKVMGTRAKEEPVTISQEVSP